MAMHMYSDSASEQLKPHIRASERIRTRVVDMRVRPGGIFNYHHGNCKQFWDKFYVCMHMTAAAQRLYRLQLGPVSVKQK